MSIKGITLRLMGVAGIVACGLLSFVTPAYAIDPPDSDPYITDIAANTYLIEDGDLLIYGLYTIPYGTLPTEEADEVYIFRLMDGTDQLGAATPFVKFDKGYNIGVFGFYFSADDAPATDEAYTIRISQNPAYFDSPQSYDYEMTTEAWTTATTQEDNRTELVLNIIELAGKLESEYDTTMLESSVGGTVLSDPAGETYFRGAIYGIQAMAPDLFLVQLLTYSTTARDWTTDQFDEYNTRFDDTFIGDATDNTSGTFGVSGTTVMSLAFGLPIMIGAILVSSIKWRRAEAGYIFSSLVMILMALMGWIDAAIFATIFQMMIMYIGYLWFYSRSGDLMGGKFLSFIAFVWLLSTLICLVVEGSWFGAAENTVVNDLAAFTNIKIGGLIPIVSAGLYFFRGIFRLFLWDFSFYTGGFVVIRILFLLVFTGSAVYGITRDFAPVFANFLRIRG